MFLWNRDNKLLQTPSPLLCPSQLQLGQPVMLIYAGAADGVTRFGHSHPVRMLLPCVRGNMHMSERGRARARSLVLRIDSEASLQSESQTLTRGPTSATWKQAEKE